MLITKCLERELRESGAVVLLEDGTDTDGRPRFVLREIQGTWGKCDYNKGGVCFTRLSNGTDHIRYASVLGYNTGRRVDVQELLLMEDTCTSFQKIRHEEWKSLLLETTKILLEAKPLDNPRITIETLTTIRYWYRDNWSGNTKSFIRLRDAKRYVRHETGTSVTIYTTVKDHTQIACIAPASGYCPP